MVTTENIENKFKEKKNSYYKISDTSFHKLLDISFETELVKDEILLHQGYVCKHIYILYAGYMIAYINDDKDIL